jgi:hypothetical protein
MTEIRGENEAEVLSTWWGGKARIVADMLWPLVDWTEEVNKLSIWSDKAITINDNEWPEGFFRYPDDMMLGEATKKLDEKAEERHMSEDR